MTSTDAFLLLQIFRRRALPALLRRLRIWKGIHRDRQADLLDDIQQELWLDCLQNADLVVQLSTRERHGRWFRLVERRHYGLSTRFDRLRTMDATLELVTDEAPAGTEPWDAPDHGTAVREPVAFDPVEEWGEQLPERRQRFLRKLSASARYLKNGRLNCRESARGMGVPPDEIKTVWGAVADDLGFDENYLQFWQRRLVEALLGLAADLLRDRGLVTVHGEPARRKPDPRGRLRRIRRLRDRIGYRPLPPDVKRILARYRTGKRASAQPPHAILEDARRLAPDDPTVHLWRFEAWLAAGEPGHALAAIRAARTCGADRVRVLLARARVLEIRGRELTAMRLLRRAAERYDPRLREALDRLAG